LREPLMASGMMIGVVRTPTPAPASRHVLTGHRGLLTTARTNPERRSAPLSPPPAVADVWGMMEEPQPLRLQPPSLHPPPIPVDPLPPPVKGQPNAPMRSTTMVKFSVFPSSSMKPSALDRFLRTTESLGGAILALGTRVTMARTLQEATMMPETMSSLATQWQEL